MVGNDSLVIASFDSVLHGGVSIADFNSQSHAGTLDKA
jgi:hypothetical protein